MLLQVFASIISLFSPAKCFFVVCLSLWRAGPAEGSDADDEMGAELEVEGVESQCKTVSGVSGSQESFTDSVDGTRHSLDSMMNANNSSVQMGVCSRTTVNSIDSDDEEENDL